MCVSSSGRLLACRTRRILTSSWPWTSSGPTSGVGSRLRAKARRAGGRVRGGRAASRKPAAAAAAAAVPWFPLSALARSTQLQRNTPRELLTLLSLTQYVAHQKSSNGWESEFLAPNSDHILLAFFFFFNLTNSPHLLLGPLTNFPDSLSSSCIKEIQVLLLSNT